MNPSWVSMIKPLGTSPSWMVNSTGRKSFTSFGEGIDEILYPNNTRFTFFIRSLTVMFSNSSGTARTIIFKLPPPSNKIQHFVRLVNKWKGTFNVGVIHSLGLVLFSYVEYNVPSGKKWEISAKVTPT